MKTSKFLFATLFCFILGSATAQEKSLKAHSNKETIDNGRIAVLLNSKTFEFMANTVYPSSGAPKNLVGSDYSVTFSPEMINSHMPFYGRAYAGMTMGRDKGMRFKGKPETFIVENNAKGYEVHTIVKDENDSFSISISVSESGYATLTISSNNRETISYHGEIVSVQ